MIEQQESGVLGDGSTITVPPFEAFPKIPRLSRECVITEKIDGTNGVILINEDLSILAGSRNRWLTEKDDNYGFCKWVMHNREELIKELGVGRHYGEWWGVGIGRGYDIFERRFSLFNTSRWKDAPITVCSVVPIIIEAEFDTNATEEAMYQLETHGSFAAPGFKRPEGIVVFHKAANSMFKKTLENDSERKGKAA